MAKEELIEMHGVVEDVLRRQRTVRCSVSTFANLGALIDGSALLATVPELVARHIRRVRPHLESRPLPFSFGASGETELVWPATVEGDAAWQFARDRIRAIAAREAADAPLQPGRRHRRRG